MKSLISRRVGKLIERAGEFESSPAIHDDEYGQGAEPDRLNLQGYKNESCGAHEAENQQERIADIRNAVPYLKKLTRARKSRLGTG